VTARPRSAAPDPIRGSALLLVGTMISMAIDFGTQILLVRHLSKIEFGAWSYALAIVVLFATVAQLEMRQAVARFVPMYLERNDRRRALGAIVLAVGLVLALGSIFAVGIIALIDVVGFRPTQDLDSLRLLGLVAILIPIQSVDGALTGVFAAFGASRTIFVRQSLIAPGLRLSVVVALVVLNQDLTFFALGYVAASAVGVVVYFGALRRVLVARILQARIAGPAKITREALPIAQMLVFVLPLLTSTLVWVLMESSDAVLLGFFFNAEAVANFRVVIPLARMNQLVATTFSVLYLPIAAGVFARGATAELADLYWRTARWMTVLSFPILVLTCAFAPVVVGTLYGQAYTASGSILALLAAAYFFQTITGFNGLTVKVHNRLRYMVVVDISMCVVNIAVNLMLIPARGALGAAVGTSVTLLLHNVLKQIGLRRFTSVPALPPDSARLYVGIVGLGLGSLVIANLVPSNLLVALVVSGIGGIVAVYLAWPTLGFTTVFPEVERLPLYRRVFRNGAEGVVDVARHDGP
jgi:O-antigen/teichoic acid export membrane protein